MLPHHVQPLEIVCQAHTVSRDQASRLVPYILWKERHKIGWESLRFHHLDVQPVSFDSREVVEEGADAVSHRVRRPLEDVVAQALETLLRPPPRILQHPDEATDLRFVARQRLNQPPRLPVRHAWLASLELKCVVP